jgi:hypothetical protein
MRPCGCEDDYHYADCPIYDREGGNMTGMTKDDYLDLMQRDDGYHDDHPPLGCE